MIEIIYRKNAEKHSFIVWEDKSNEEDMFVCVWRRMRMRSKIVKRVTEKLSIEL